MIKKIIIIIPFQQLQTKEACGGQSGTSSGICPMLDDYLCCLRIESYYSFCSRKNQSGKTFGSIGIETSSSSMHALSRPLCSNSWEFSAPAVLLITVLFIMVRRTAWNMVLGRQVKRKHIFPRTDRTEGTTLVSCSPFFVAFRTNQ